MQGKIISSFLGLVLLFCLLSCKNNSQLRGYSNLFPDQTISKVVVLPFEPADNFADQATAYVEYYLSNNSSIAVVPSAEVLKTYDKNQLSFTKLSEKTVNNICNSFQAQLIVTGEALLHQNYSSFNKQYSYEHDVTIKLLDSKNGAVVAEHKYEKQTGKLEETVRKLVDKVIDDMRWSPLDEMRDDVFDNDENNSALP